MLRTEISEFPAASSVRELLLAIEAAGAPNNSSKNMVTAPDLGSLKLRNITHAKKQPRPGPCYYLGNERNLLHFMEAI